MAARRLVFVLVVGLLLASEIDAQEGRGKGKRRASEVPRAAPTAAPKGSPTPTGPIYLPGSKPDDPEAKDGKSPKPGGSKGGQKNDPKGEKPKPGRPANPLAAADEITRAEDYRNRASEAQARFLQEHFAVCDLDANGWLSLREAEVTLSLDRTEYRRADENQDGRLELAEFTAQEALLLARLGTGPGAGAAEPAREPPSAPDFVGPLPLGGDVPPADTRPSRGRRRDAIPGLVVTPVDLVARYDADRSRGLALAEIEKLFADTGLELSAGLTLAQMDPDASGELELGELHPLALLVSQHLPDALRPDVETPDASSGSAAATGEDPPAQPSGSHFVWLDASADGFIDESDLRAVLSPVTLDLRLKSMISAMDRDGDGRLSEEEFRRGMIPTP